MRDDIVKRQVLAVGGNATDSGREHGGAMVITVAGDDDVAVWFRLLGGDRQTRFSGRFRRLTSQKG